MKKKGIIFIVLTVIVGLSVLFFTNCGGITPNTQTNNPLTKGWTVVGSAGFSANTANNLSLFVYRDTPYVAYLDGDIRQATIMKFNGSTWESVGTQGISSGISLGSTYYISLVVYNYIPYLAFSSIDRISVLKFNGSTWESLGIPEILRGHVFNYSLAVDNGTPFLAFKDDSTYLYGATVMKFNGSSWEVIGTSGFSSGNAYFISLVVDNSIPYVAYQGTVNGSDRATVMKFTGSAWESVGIPGFSTGANFFPLLRPSLSVYNGIPFLAYATPPDTAGDSYPKATVVKFNGTSWEGVGSPDFIQTEPVYLQVYNGTPYVAFVETAIGLNLDRISVMKFNGTDWEYVGNAGFSTLSHSRQNISFFISDNGTPYVAYSDVDNGNKATVMRYQ